MICYQKKLFFKQIFTIEIKSDCVQLCDANKHIKYEIQLSETTLLNWKLQEKSFELKAFGVQIDNRWEYFEMPATHINYLKNFFDGKVQYHSISNLYEMVKYIGKGAYGQVFICRNKSLNTMVACKSIQKGVHYSQQNFRNEVSAMQNLKHPCIVKLLEYYAEEKHFYIIMEYIKGVSLKKVIENHHLNEHQQITIIKQLLKLTHYIHSEGYIYRDFKTENILLFGNSFEQLKLIDFGFAIRQDETMNSKQQICGTLGHLAPELFRNDYFYDYTSDIFSLGVVIYEIYTGQFLMKVTRYKEMIEVNKSYKYNDEILESIKNTNIKTILASFLHHDPKQRMTAAQALEIIDFLEDEEGIIEDISTANSK